MLRVESTIGFTEFEEDILFDSDDPDFFAIPHHRHKMSLASVHPVELHSSHSSLATLSHSLDDITIGSAGSGRDWSSPALHSDHVLTIEELRLQMTSCFTCGVSWSDSHVSLDCSECGGYAMERPCQVCDGTCGAKWKRDLSMSHASGKARWEGQCGRKATPTKSTTNEDAANTSDLTQRLEQLNAHS